jgi:hypothetical protein
MHTTLEGTDDITAECVGKSFIEAPNQRPGSTDCGAALHEFGQRLVYNESVTEFYLAGNGHLLRICQAIEILQFIFDEGVN